MQFDFKNQQQQQDGKMAGAQDMQSTGDFAEFNNSLNKFELISSFSNFIIEVLEDNDGLEYFHQSKSPLPVKDAKKVAAAQVCRSTN